MHGYLIWFIAGFVLIIAELLTGTFFLLMLGAGAFAGGLITLAGAPFWLQAFVAGVVAAIGVFVLQKRKKSSITAPGDNQLDAGHHVQFDSWVNETARLARVRYRGAIWEATVISEQSSKSSEQSLKQGDVLFIKASEGNMLRVSTSKI